MARGGPAGVHGDLVRRRFITDAPDRLRLTDITEHPAREGKVHMAVVLDLYGRRVVGWSIADRLRAELVVGLRRHRLRAAGLPGSMGRVESAYDAR